MEAITLFHISKAEVEKIVGDVEGEGEAQP